VCVQDYDVTEFIEKLMAGIMEYLSDSYGSFIQDAWLEMVG
jgi:hypothetical protein